MRRSWLLSLLHAFVRCPVCEQRTGAPPYGCCVSCQRFLDQALANDQRVERDPLFIAPYAGPWERLIHALKYHRFELVAQFFAVHIAHYTRSLGWPPRPVTFVPTTRERRIARGYDQAERLAHYVAAALGTRVVALAGRASHSGPLARLPSRAHRLQIDAGFYLRQSSVTEPVWLIDDVLTTGTTLQLVTDVLSAGGVQVERRITAVKTFTRPGSRSEYEARDEPQDGAYKDLRIRMTEEGF